METGTVKWFNKDKGFGYIHPDDERCDLFVDHSGINHEFAKFLHKDQRVVFETVRGPHGEEATNVSPITE